MDMFGSFENGEETAPQVLHQNMMAARESFVSKVFNSKLAALRAQNPFLPIVPVHDKSINVSLKANVPIDCSLPSGTKMIMIRRYFPNNAVICSFNGLAQIFTPVGTIGFVESDSGSFVVDDNVFIYVEEIQSLSLITANDSFCTVMCWSQL